MTASKDGDKKCETYLMFRIAKGSAKPDKAHESFGIAQPDGRRNHLSSSYKDSNTHTRRHTHTDTYTLLSRKRAHRFLLCCTPKSVCCFLFVRYFKFNYPVMKWAATDTATAPNSSPHWLTKVCRLVKRLPNVKQQQSQRQYSEHAFTSRVIGSEAKIPMNNN